MTKAEDIEARALEYGSLVSNIRDKKKELEEVTTGLTEANAELAKVKAEIEANKDANDRVRTALLDEEKRLEDLKKQKADELQSERTIVEAQRRENDAKTAELNAISDALDKRGHSLTGREKTLASHQAILDEEKKKLQTDSIALSTAQKDLELREVTLSVGKKDLLAQTEELEKKLRENKALESNGKAALETARLEAQRASDDRIKEQGHMHEAQHFAQARQDAEKQLRQLLPVFYDVRDFIKNHVKNPDQIENYISQKFPEEAKIPDDIKTPANV